MAAQRDCVRRAAVYLSGLSLSPDRKRSAKPLREIVVAASGSLA
jgi:hypothetical protein